MGSQGTEPYCVCEKKVSQMTLFMEERKSIEWSLNSHKNWLKCEPLLQSTSLPRPLFNLRRSLRNKVNFTPLKFKSIRFCWPSSLDWKGSFDATLKNPLIITGGRVFNEEMRLFPVKPFSNYHPFIKRVLFTFYANVLKFQGAVVHINTLLAETGVPCISNDLTTSNH